MNYIQNIIDRQLGTLFRFNYDGVLKRLVVGSEDSFYGLPNPLVPRPAGDQDPPIFACRFAEASGYQHILALANEDGGVAIQDTSKSRIENIVEGFQCHNNAVFDLAWMPGHMNFVTVSGDHTACLWDIANGALTRMLIFSHHSRSVKTAVFRPQEPSVFATGARDGHLLLWDIRASTTPVNNVILKPDNTLWNCHSSFAPKTPGSGTKRARAQDRAISITGLVFQDDMTLLSCGECDGNIKVWDLRKNYNIYKREPLPKHAIPYCGSSAKNGYTNLIVDSARVRLYASCMDNVIYCFNISTYNALPEQRYVGHENSTFYIKTSLSPDSMYLVSGSSDKNAYIWNVKYSQPIVKLTGHWAEVTCASWCQDGPIKIVTCSDDARHKIWKIGTEIDDSHELKGKAEIVPYVDVTTLPQWGSLDKTPSSVKRKLSITPSSYSAKRSRTQESSIARKTKRCLADLMNAPREEDQENFSNKRIKLEAIQELALTSGIKRHSDSETSPCKKKSIDDTSFNSIHWSYVNPQPGTSFMTPTKKYEKRSCKKISPKSPKQITPDDIQNRSPIKVSPSKVRIITFGTPTKDLPDFVLNGEAPHLRLMSPAKKKQEPTNWLIKMGREKRSKLGDSELPLAPLSPKENIPTRRNSVTLEKTPKSIIGGGTLLKYFNIAKKEKEKL